MTSFQHIRVKSFKNKSKQLLKRAQNEHQFAIYVFNMHLNVADENLATLKLQDAQKALALSHGCDSWGNMVETLNRGESVGINHPNLFVINPLAPTIKPLECDSLADVKGYIDLVNQNSDNETGDGVVLQDKESQLNEAKNSQLYWTQTNDAEEEKQKAALAQRLEGNGSKDPLNDAVVGLAELFPDGLAQDKELNRKKIDDFCKRKGIPEELSVSRLNEHIDNTDAALKNGTFVFLSGGSGTGKSWVIEKLISKECIFTMKGEPSKSAYPPHLPQEAFDLIAQGKIIAIDETRVYAISSVKKAILRAIDSQVGILVGTQNEQYFSELKLSRDDKGSTDIITIKLNSQCDGAECMPKSDWTVTKK